MWSPTHIQVTVQRAKGLLTKGKNGTNNCFVTIALGKEKYQTSVKDKAETNVSWNEECELKIPDQGNRAELTLTCLHRNNLGIDEFLGQATLPLNEMDVYDRPRSKWFKLESKPGKEKKNKERGELEIRICFVVKSGSLTDLSKKEKHKSSIGQLASSVGGSLLSIGTIEKRKGIKKFAKSIGSKMHLSSKKKNKDGDDVSNFSGSFASIDTPNSSNSGSRRYGQRAGEADPGVISEDEDEFVFDNLSHKSSSSSLNMRTNLQAPTQNYVPRNPSPLLGKVGGKQLSSRRDLVEEDLAVDPVLEEIENDFSVRARTLPPPSKPPRTQQQINDALLAAGSPKQKDAALDEWESKLYKQNFQLGNSDSLKRRSWEPTPVPLPTASEGDEEVEVEQKPQVKVERDIKDIELKEENNLEQQTNNFTGANNTHKNQGSDSSSLLSSGSDEELFEENVRSKKPQELKLNPQPAAATKNISLISPDKGVKDFDELNASFAKFEQRNKSNLFDLDDEKKWHTQSFIEAESTELPGVPKAKPRNREREAELKRSEEEQEAEHRRQAEAHAKAKAASKAAEAEAKAVEDAAKAAADAEANAIAKAARMRQAELEATSIAAEVERRRQEKFAYEQQLRAAEDARLEEELRRNEQKLREEEATLQEELRQREEEKRREAKRLEEDQRILNFAKRSTSLEEEQQIQSPYGTPEKSPTNGMLTDKHERRMGKYKYLNNKRDKSEDNRSTPSPKSNERIIIGHEKSTSHADRRSEISAALAKKYEGKSREELMLIANGMENEALLQRQRVKELEDYLDNLLLRVMETHPKILQNPYSRTTSTKSG
ncbi:rab11 family-interacting protein 1 [Eurosta solidaginis]|uniref:rab11 family-interacting protein 1 n=1 Tax=Eurosta solidaginis TaxID=178769 RepID=UPI003531425C